MSAVQEKATLALWDELERLLARVERHVPPAGSDEFGEHSIASEETPGGPDSLTWTKADDSPAVTRWNPVTRLRDLFGLTSFETDTLLLCAGFALDRRFAAACATAQPDAPGGTAAWPTFGLAMSVLDDPHWSA